PAERLALGAVDVPAVVRLAGGLRRDRDGGDAAAQEGEGVGDLLLVAREGADGGVEEGVLLREPQAEAAAALVGQVEQQGARRPQLADELEYPRPARRLVQAVAGPAHPLLEPARQRLHHAEEAVALLLEERAVLAQPGPAAGQLEQQRPQVG